MVQVATPAVLQPVHRASPHRVPHPTPMVVLLVLVVLLQLGGVGHCDLACVGDLTAGLGGYVVDGGTTGGCGGLLLTGCSQLCASEGILFRNQLFMLKFLLHSNLLMMKMKMMIRTGLA